MPACWHDRRGRSSSTSRWPDSTPPAHRGLLRLLEDLRRNAGLTVVVISHDFSGLEDLCPRILHLQDGERLPHRRPQEVCHDSAVAQADTQACRAAAAGARSHGHDDLWAGTKLIVVAGIGVMLTFYPGWVPIGVVAAHNPRGRLAGAHSAGHPAVDTALAVVPVDAWRRHRCGRRRQPCHRNRPGLDLGLGGLLKFLRITALSIVLLGLGGMVSWTTNVAEIAPAVAKLGRPLRLLRVPVDEWAVALALALRAFPMLIDEFRILYAARSLRPKPVLTTRRERRHRWALEIVDLIAAAVIVALRRADEMGDAVTARVAPVRSPPHRRGPNGVTGWHFR